MSVISKQHFTNLHFYQRAKKTLQSKECLSWDLSLIVSEPEKKRGGENLQARGPMCKNSPNEGELGQSRESFSMAGGQYSIGRIRSSKNAWGPLCRVLWDFSLILDLTKTAVGSHSKILNEGWGENEGKKSSLRVAISWMRGDDDVN